MKTNMMVTGIMVLVFLVFFTVPSFAQIINGCYHNKNGKLRVVSDLSLCKKTELPITWNASSGSNSGWELTGNAGTNPSTNFVGTLDNTELHFRVNDTVGLRIIPTSDTPNIIGGSSSNTFIDGVMGGVIGGGGSSSEPNYLNGFYGTIGGGSNNRVGQSGAPPSEAATHVTVAGGTGNIATYSFSTIGGGSGNAAYEAGCTVAGGIENHCWGSVGTVAGGTNNTADGQLASVGGGENNMAGFWATVPGGSNNAAAGVSSFAAGSNARANGHGCFVWGDGSTDDFVTCDTDNRWVARTSGGVYFYTNSGLTSGVYVAAGGGSWSSVSDRNMKANFAPVDGRDILVRLASVPIATWNYKTQDTSILHMGPTAQDLHAAFGLGESDKHINTIDAEGVALAAIQGLYKVVQEKEAEISALKQENRELNERMNRIEKRLAVMEIPVATLVQK